MFKMSAKGQNRTMNLVTFLLVVNLALPVVVGAQHAILVSATTYIISFIQPHLMVTSYSMAYFRAFTMAQYNSLLY